MSGRVAVITGAGRGLGREVGHRLADIGYTVVLTGRRPDELEAAAADMMGSVDTALLDIGSDASIDTAIPAIVARHGRIDVLINNAGRLFGGREQGVEVGAALLAEAIDNNALGAWRMMQRVLPIMAESGYGRIVNVSSGMGALGSFAADAVAYRISKLVLNGLTLISASAAGAQIKINAVCPGWVRTEMGGPGATRSLEDGARGIVWAATLPDDGPSGGFFRDGRRIAW